MSDSGSSFWKPIAILLTLALAGVYALYDWYSGELGSQLANAATQLKESVILKAKAEEAAQVTRAEMDAIKQHEEELAGSKVGLEHDMESLKASYSAELETERGKVAKAIAERDEVAKSVAEKDAASKAAQEHAAKLEADLNKMQKVIADTTAEHRAKIIELERQLNDRISLARSTPMDSKLLSTAEELGLLKPEAPDPAEGNAESADPKVLLSKAQTDYETTLGELEKTKAELAQAKADLEKARSELETSKKEHAAEMGAAQRKIDDLTAQLQSLRSGAQTGGLQERLNREAKVVADIKADTRAALEAAQADGGSKRKDIESKLAAVNQRLADEKLVREDLERVQATSVDDLQQTLETTRQDLDAVREQLDATAKAVGAEDQDLVAQVAKARQRLATLESSLEHQHTVSAEVKQSLSTPQPTTAADLRALNAGIEDLGGTFTDHGLLLRFAESELHFTTGKADLPEGPLSSLDRVAKLLNEQPTLAVRIEGHTDSQGSERANVELSKQRAEAVRSALIERGVDGNRMVADGFGHAHPIGDNATPEGRSENRRVEIYILE